jgi:DNA-binding GntR family transcriptional regulator
VAVHVDRGGQHRRDDTRQIRAPAGVAIAVMICAFRMARDEAPPAGKTRAPRRKTPREGESVERAFMAVREAILMGRFEPGVPVSQVTIASELGVSRTPLREALRMLQREGLVRFEPNQRIRIPSLTVSDVEGLYVMRIALEAVAIRLTIPAFGPRQIARLEELYTAMGQTAELLRAGPETPERARRETTAWAKDASHREFHARFVAGAGETVADRIAELSEYADRYRIVYRLARADAIGQSMLEHRAMIDAAASGDVDATVAALTAHYARAANDVIEELDPRFVSARLATTVAAVAPPRP